MQYDFLAIKTWKNIKKNILKTCNYENDSCTQNYSMHICVSIYIVSYFVMRLVLYALSGNGNKFQQWID